MMTDNPIKINIQVANPVQAMNSTKTCHISCVSMFERAGLTITWGATLSPLGQVLPTCLFWSSPWFRYASASWHVLVRGGTSM
jgi:hypothetical protein